MSNDDSLPRRALARLPEALAIVAVLGAYAFFAGGGSLSFRRIRWDQSMYASLSEGFFRGHLYMAHQPDARLTALSFPYDFKAREGIDYLWDASYLNGHYYLYFSPFAAIVFYMPYRLLRGGYPRDALAAAVFSAWAFLAAVAFARRTLALTGRRPLIPFPLWVMFIGLSNVVVFLLADIRIYEVAIMTGMALTATWAYALVRFVESPTAKRAVWMSAWLALAIAARPNLGVLLLVSAFAVITALKSRRALLASLAPLAIVFATMVAYNMARFSRPLEFGETYQLTFVPMEGRAVCRLCTLPELSRLGNSAMHYLFWPVTIRSDFPFIEVQYANLDPKVSFPMPGSEPVVGLAPLAPLTMLGTLFAVLFALRRDRPDLGTRAAMLVMAGAWLILLALSTCWWVVSRYSLDFMLLMAAASAVCIESGLAWLASTGVRLLPLRIAVAATACYSVAAGFMLGFAGGFKHLHPELFKRIAEALK